MSRAPDGDMATGDVAVITGGSSGIGLACVDALQARGLRVHVIDRTPCPRDGVSSHMVDVTDAAALASVERALDAPLRAVVCAAGIWDGEGDGGPTDMDLAVWDRTLAVNLTGTMLTVRTFADRLADDGAIVTVASVAALAGMPRRDAYSASKGALVALTRAWALDFSRRGIRVNCVCPGVTRTAMTDGLFEALDQDRMIALPQQRPAQAEEIAAVIAFVASPEASYLSGAIIPVDGGASAGLAGLPFPQRRRPA
jgi:NAD(P)-dependent dehydrogenase (short-subunit alcohol dehydrogenase family)